MDKNNQEWITEEANNFFKYDYHDRGMLKWQGFFLSDHTARLKREQNTPKVVAKPEQPIELISKRLKLSWEYGKVITLQLNQIMSNNEVTQLTGYVKGYFNTMIVLEDSNNNMQNIQLEEIRNCFLE